MKGLVSLLLGAALFFGVPALAQASDWDIAGKILTGIEGMRILTGGRVDIFGTITGTGRNEGYEANNRGSRRDEFSSHNSCERVWVPHYTWEKRWVPQHSECDERLGEVIVEGHYVRYKAESGGHWEYAGSSKNHSCRNSY